MSAKIIDTHCHLDSEKFDEDLTAVLECAFRQGIEKIIIPAADTKTLKKAVQICERYEDIYFSVGIHPLECESGDFSLLKEFITHRKCVAVGECGYDYFYHKEDEFKKKQREVFAKQIELALEYEKPLIIHSREANNDTFEMLSSFIKNTQGKFRNGKGYGVLHCFNASEHLLNLKEYFYFGIGGVLTFKNAKNLLEILPKIPRERLLLETDAPYLAPEPYRGKRNEPAFTRLVAQKIAELLNLSLNEVVDICTANSSRLFFKDAK